MTEAEGLVIKQRANGLLIDTNLLLLLVVGLANPSRIERFDRTWMYTRRLRYRNIDAINFNHSRTL